MPAKPKSKVKAANGRRRTQTKVTFVPRPNPLALTTPASLGQVLSLSLGAGIDHAFILLGHLPHEKRTRPMDDLCLAYWQAQPEDRPTEDTLDEWVRERGVETWEMLGWVVMSIGALGGNAAQIIINQSKFPIVKASLERALNDPVEAKAWLESFGHFPVKSNAQIINVSASAQAVAAASAAERGLPAFSETTDEADDALRALPATTAIDVEFTPVTEKETANVRFNP